MSWANKIRRRRITSILSQHNQLTQRGRSHRRAADASWILLHHFEVGDPFALDWFWQEETRLNADLHRWFRVVKRPKRWDLISTGYCWSSVATGRVATGHI